MLGQLSVGQYLGFAVIMIYRYHIALLSWYQSTSFLPEFSFSENWWHIRKVFNKYSESMHSLFN